MRVALKAAFVTASVFLAVPAFAKSLTCQGQSIAITADINSTVQYTNVKAVDEQGDDLHASGLEFLDLAGPSNAYSIRLEALDDTCIVNLPKKVLTLSSFVTHLVCFDQNGKVVNDDGAIGQAGQTIPGETLDCKVK